MTIFTNETFLDKWQGIELCISLPRCEVDRYKPLCLPRTTRNTPLLPSTNQQANSWQPTPINMQSNIAGQPLGSHIQPPLGNVALRRATVQSSAAPPPARPTKDMYWCFEKVFTEPTEHHMFTIFNSEALYDD